MRTPKGRTMMKAAVGCLALLAVGACSELDLSGSQDLFQVGSTYHFLTFYGDGNVRIIEAPDEHGWALVEIVEGFSGVAEGEVLLNTSDALFAKRVESELVE